MEATRSVGLRWRCVSTGMITWLFIGVSIFSLTSVVDGVLPTGRIGLQLLSQHPQFGGVLCSPSHNSGWGVTLPDKPNSRWKRIHVLSQSDASNAEGCTSYTLPTMADPAAPTAPVHRTLTGVAHQHYQQQTNSATMQDKFATLVIADRGNCSFLQKALNAQAAGARGLVIRGTKKAVYESIRNSNKTNTTLLSSAAEQNAQKPMFEYDCSRGESFVTTLADPFWATDDAKCSSNARCESHRCILTGKMDTAREKHQLCCMWDTYILMGANRTQAANVSIPVVYVTIADGEQLERSVTSYPSLLIRTFRRDQPLMDIASVLLWLIGVTTAVGGSYYSAASDRRRYLERMNPNLTHERKQQQHHEESLHDNEHHTLDEIWELDSKHAVGFIIFAGVFLTIFYFVKVNGVIPILFCISGAATLAQLVMAPLLHACIPSVASRQIPLPATEEAVPLSEIIGLLLSGSLAVVWYVHRRSYWLLQDIFGISLCFIFLRTVQLPNLKVATVLLCLAFCYDVFFVFLTPLIFGSSVMEDVATGGPSAASKSDYPGIDYCERYPDYTACLDPEPMPMLLVLPRILNWVGGVSMLGLGDIILPGMLLSFALRFDYSVKSLGENYYRSVCIGYAVGLALANIAVTITQMGQPALMYLVPTTLGTLVVSSWQNGDFMAMWLGVETEKKYDQNDDDAGELGYNTRAVTPTGRASASNRGSPAVNDSVHDDAPLLGSSFS